MTKIACAIIRVSSVEQEEKGWGIPTQQREIQEYCARVGLHLPNDYILVEDITGDTELEKRKIHKRVFQLMKEKKISAVVIWKAHRLARKKWIIERFIDQAVLPNDIEFHITDIGQIQDSNDIRLTIENWSAQKDKDELLKKFKAAKRTKALSGKYSGEGYIPYGYKKIGSKKNASLVINPEEEIWVKRIFQLYLTSRSIVQIIEEFTRLGVPTQQGIDKWSPATIYNILKNESYTGIHYTGKTRREKVLGENYKGGKQKYRITEKLPKEKWIALEIPAIISKEDFDAVQKSLGSGMRINKPRRNLLAGFCVCGKCGANMIGSFSGKIRYYRCASSYTRNSPKRQYCGIPMVKTSLIEGEVRSFLLDLIFDKPDELIQEVLDSRKNNQDIEIYQQGLVLLRDQMAKAEKQLAKLLKLYLANADSDDDDLQLYQQNELELKEKIKAHKAEIARLEGLIADTGLSETEVNNFIENLRIIQSMGKGNVFGKYTDINPRKNFLAFLADNPENDRVIEIDNFMRDVMAKINFRMIYQIEDSQKVIYMHLLKSTVRLPIGNDSTAMKAGISPTAYMPCSASSRLSRRCGSTATPRSMVC